MVPQSISRFPHRHSLDGSHDSICILCHLTVATRRNEADLALFERDHVCSLSRLCDLSADLNHVRTPLSL